MIDSERQELLDLIDRTFTELGGRATKADVLTAIGELPPHLSDYCARQGLNSMIGSYFRKRRDGLPQAPEVAQDGTHAQLELWTVEHCQYLVAHYMSRAESNEILAQKVADYCFARYAVAIDITNPVEGAA